MRIRMINLEHCPTVAAETDLCVWEVVDFQVACHTQGVPCLENTYRWGEVKRQRMGQGHPQGNHCYSVLPKPRGGWRNKESRLPLSWG